MTEQQRISNYPHRMAGHCGSGALRDLMHWAGLSYGPAPLDEGTIFGLGGELGFTYLRHPAMTPPIYLVGRGPDLTGAFTRRLGITATQHTTDDPDEGWAWVRDELDQGYPVLCWADIAELPYLRVRLSMSRHDIVITGYNDNTRTATVIDNDRPDPQPVPYNALARARNSTGFPTPTRHTTYRLRYPTRLPPLATTAADACHAAAHALRHPRSLLGDNLDEIPDLVHHSGLDGVTAFVDDLARWPDLFPPINSTPPCAPWPRSSTKPAPAEACSAACKPTTCTTSPTTPPCQPHDKPPTPTPNSPSSGTASHASPPPTPTYPPASPHSPTPHDTCPPSNSKAPTTSTSSPATSSGTGLPG